LTEAFMGVPAYEVLHSYPVDLKLLSESVEPLFAESAAARLEATPAQ
jgi:hypothetical protein